tara:strand:- start:1107 stop:2201 length:1095 start_codon:yes stop_codon:yes gene_type:complete
MDVGIAGAGNIAMAYAALLELDGHKAKVWSPSGRGTEALTAGRALNIEGKIEGDFYPKVATSAKELAEVDVILLALPAYGHRRVIDALVPYIEARHTLIISGHLSLAALYLARKLADRGIQIPIVAWSTTLTTSKPRGEPNQYLVRAIREKIDMATIPATSTNQALETCVALFGNRFNVKDDILTIALSNINPQNHLAIALCNLTRIERGENWGQNTMAATSTVGGYIEAMDGERLAVANAYGKTVRTILDHYRLSFGVEEMSVAAASAKLVENGGDPTGPGDLETRWITEDAPFGLVPTIYLADLAGVPVPLHKSSLTIINACCGRDFAAANDILPELGLLDLKALPALLKGGYLHRSARYDS